ncbi:MAG: hypothetical protein ACYC6W_09625 [Nitrosotalea sp.]
MTTINLPKISDKKTIAFVSLGIILYLGSAYLNILKTSSADIGVYSGIGLIILGSLAQIKNWLIYWKKDILSS